MSVYRKVMFPYDKVRPNSKVVLYGAGNIGSGIYREIKKSHYCHVVAIVDRTGGKMIDNISVGGLDRIVEVEFDYIIICTIRGYQEEMCEKLFDMNISQDKIVCVDEVTEFTEVKTSTMVNSFHHIMVEEKYRYISMETNPELFEWYRNCINWIKDTEKMTKILLLGYEFISPVFHVVDKDKRYLGTIDRKAINEISRITKWSDCNLSAGELCELLNAHNVEINKASNISISVYEIYKRFSRENNLLELPLIKDTVLVDVIKKTDFEACFSREMVMGKTPYVAGRFKEFDGNTGLNRFAFNINSQNGEDGIVEHIFNKIGFESHYAVEFGGWDGIYLSNIRNLVLNNDMNALFIEGDASKVIEGKKNYDGRDKVKFVNEWVGFRKNKKLDDILKENDVPVNIDLLSIDIDGYDYQVWDSLKRYRPRTVIIEYNPALSNQIIMINPDNENMLCGSSPLALVELGKRKGYELVAVTLCNCIFVVKEEYERFNIFDNSLDCLRNGSMKECVQPILTYRGDVLNNCLGIDRWEL